MKEDLDDILELRNPDTDDHDQLLEPSLRRRVILMVLTLVLLTVTMAPVGIMVIVPIVDIHASSVYESVDGFLMVSIFIGLVSIWASNPKVFKFIFRFLFVLALLNAGGCVKILNDLGNI